MVTKEQNLRMKPWCCCKTRWPAWATCTTRYLWSTSAWTAKYKISVYDKTFANPHCCFEIPLISRSFLLSFHLSIYLPTYLSVYKYTSIYCSLTWPFGIAGLSTTVHRHTQWYSSKPHLAGAPSLEFRFLPETPFSYGQQLHLRLLLHHHYQLQQYQHQQYQDYLFTPINNIGKYLSFANRQLRSVKIVCHRDWTSKARALNSVNFLL